MAPRTDYRSRADQEAFDKLLALQEIKDAIEKAEKDAEKVSARHQLLATALRLSHGMAPVIERAMAGCARKLGVETEVETFVYPLPHFNAACVRPEHGRVFVMLSSALVEAFDERELAFVIGHELGHHVFDHHRIPVHLLLGGTSAVSAPLAMQLFAWQRHAEISADRAGLLCCGSLEGATGALFKLASGLKGGAVQADPATLLTQLGDMRSELENLDKVTDSAPRGDWFATHPFSPLRLNAAKLFAESDLMKPGGRSRDQLEAETQELMGLMEPGYLKEKSDAAEAMRRLLFAGGFVVAAASDGISDEEVAQMEKFFGEGTLPRRPDPVSLKRDLARRMDDVKENVPQLRRAQVLRDLCLVALADGVADEEERKALHEIADGIGVGRALVERTLAGVKALD